AEVIDEQGDTVGVGTLNFFGQFGNTNTDYPVTVDFDAIPDNFNATMVFHYDTSVCLLSFPCTATGIENQNKNQQVSIYPNPFSSETTLHSEISFLDLTINVFNLQGQLVKHLEHQSGSEITLQRGDLVNGIYVVQLVEGKKMIGMRRVIVGE
ncbi:MAG: T9SS type A sorting domain-containing protein, partial [Saprospiraceae bacterium]